MVSLISKDNWTVYAVLSIFASPKSYAVKIVVLDVDKYWSGLCMFWSVRILICEHLELLNFWSGFK